MRYRILLAVPVLYLAALLVAQQLLPPADVATLHRWAGFGAKVLASVGCIAAAVRFARGDYMRMAWWLMGGCYVLLVIADLSVGRTSRFEGVTSSDLQTWVRALMVLTANVLAVVGAWLFARAWKVAGLMLPGSRASQAIVVGGAVVVSLVIVGPTLLGDFRALAGGDAQAAVSMGSDLGDVLSFTLIAPIFLTAWALRGGLLAWPWWLLTVGNVGWLLYDAAGMVGRFSGLSSANAEELFRALACTAYFAAGFAQRFAVSRDAPAQPAADVAPAA